VDQKLDHTVPFVIRLDGHRFSKFTKGFKKPFDERIYYAMVYTTADLLKEFNPFLAYTQSDEITLAFVPQFDQNNENKGIMFNGRIQKIVSLMSGFCSSRFSYHLSRQIFDPENEQKILDKIHLAYFDGRIFNVPTLSEVLYNIIWRMTDAKRNSKNNLGHIHFPQREVEGLHPGQILDKLLNEKGVDWNEMPGPFKWGCFLKKSQYEKDSENPITGEKIIATRTRIATASFDLRYSDESIPLLSAKFTNETSFHDQFQPIPNYN